MPKKKDSTINEVKISLGFTKILYEQILDYRFANKITSLTKTIRLLIAESLKK